MKGFTIVELAVVMAVMVILLTIGVVSYRSTQMTARDREREMDVAAIATHMESLYSQVIRDGSTVIKPAGSYPSRAALSTSAPARRQLILGDLAVSALSAPGGTRGQALITNTNPASTTNLTQATVTPTVSITQYIYVPQVTANGHTCDSISTECRAFKIFYRTEQGEYKIVESKHK